jgi:hypothetical protein
VHLFRAELFTQPTTEPRTRRVVRAGGMSLALRAQFKDVYIPCTMTTNNAGWERGWLRTMCGSRTGGWSLPCVMSD